MSACVAAVLWYCGGAVDIINLIFTQTTSPGFQQSLLVGAFNRVKNMAQRIKLMGVK